LKSIDDLLLNIANQERNLEIQRKENLETKAQRFTTFGGIFISIISTYFFFTANNQETIPILIKWFLILTITIFGVSEFLLLLSMRTLRDNPFNIESLAIQIVNLKLDVATGKVSRNLLQYTKVIRGVNNHRARLLFFGSGLFFAGLIFMICGIIATIFIT